MTTPTQVQTARNNASLRAIRAWFNAAIYQTAVELMNDGGPAAVADFIGRQFHAECRPARVAAIMAGEMPAR